MKLSKSLTSVALAGSMVLGATAAMADGYGRGSIKDAPYVAPFSWTGFYVGVNAGYAWGDSSHSSAMSCPGVTTCAYTIPANLSTIGALGSGSVSPDGFTGGVQAGYNLQTGSTVFGVEIDFNALDLGASRAATAQLPAAATAPTVVTGIDTDWLMTLRGRLGFTLSPNLLVYATGGLALADITVSNSFNDNFVSIGGAADTIGSASSSKVKAGYALGGGLEWALDRNWSVKGEYLYVDFGSISTTSAPSGFPGLTANSFSTSADLTAHMARAGINYKF